MSINTGGPAFPVRAPVLSADKQGMTLRDYFAASMVSSGHVFKVINEGRTPEQLAAQAYVLADAMLKARES